MWQEIVNNNYFVIVQEFRCVAERLSHQKGRLCYLSIYFLSAPKSFCLPACNDGAGPCKYFS